MLVIWCLSQIGTEYKVLKELIRERDREERKSGEHLGILLQERNYLGCLLSSKQCSRPTFGKRKFRLNQETTEDDTKGVQQCT